jgi:anti-anti-sigma regulatory factor
MLDETCPVQWIGQQALVTLPQHINSGNASQIREQLLWIISRGAAVLIADLTGTLSCDFSGADALTRAYQRAMANGTELRLVVTADVVRRVLARNCPAAPWPWFGADGICRYHGEVKGLKTLFRALSVRQARHMTDAVLPAALIGGGLAVHHAGRGERQYLSFDAAGSTSALPQDEEEMITTVVHADQIDCRGRPWGGS